MPIKILMPALSPTMTEGNLAKWHKKPGDKVKAGDVIAEIETDKATMEVEAVDEGTMGKILVAEGTENVAVNAPIALLLAEGETEADLAKADAGGGPAPAQKAKADESAPPQAKQDAPKAPQGSAPPAQPQPQQQAQPQQAQPQQAQPQQTQGASGERIFASPLAKRIAADRNIDLAGVQGSGPHGRIVKADVESAKPGAAAPAPQQAAAGKAAPQAQAAGDGTRNVFGQRYTLQPNNNIRKVIAKRLLEAKQTVPHFYLTIDCRIDKLLDLRKEINTLEGVKVSVNDLVIKATAAALRKVPAANASWSDEGILLFSDVDVSVAVATPNGLITPIIKNADTKSVSSISAEMKDLGIRAREGKLKPEEFQGGGFSISNLGMYGVKHFAAIINPPQACILAVGAGEKRAVVGEGDKIEVANVMTCTLSVDHRAVDGAVGAQFFEAFKEIVENPMRMLV